MFKVLLVEDEEMIRKGLRFTFDWMGAACVVVGKPRMVRTDCARSPGSGRILLLSM